MQRNLSQPCYRLFATFLVLLASLWMSSAPATDFAANFGGTTGANFNQNASTFDAARNAYIVGTFTDASLTISTVTITKIGATDTVVTKIDASGAVVWAKTFGGSGAYAYGESIAVDPSGNVYLGGVFYNAAGLPVTNIDPGPNGTNCISKLGFPAASASELSGTSFCGASA